MKNFCCSAAKSCTTLCDPMNCSMAGFPVLQHLLEFAQIQSIKSLMLSNHLILCHLLLLYSIFPTSGFPPPPLSELALCIRWPKCQNFSFSISPSNENSRLFSFSIYWFDFLAVQETLKSLLQHHNSKASILQCSTFFVIQFSHLYMTTRKTIALTIWTFVGKMMSLLYNILSMFVMKNSHAKHLSQRGIKDTI